MHAMIKMKPDAPDRGAQADRLSDQDEPKSARRGKGSSGKRSHRIAISSSSDTSFDSDASATSDSDSSSSSSSNEVLRRRADADNVEQYGLLTVNRHQFALEYEPDSPEHKPSNSCLRSKPNINATRKPTVQVKIASLKDKKTKRKCKSARKQRNEQKTSSAAAVPAERMPDTISICTAHSRYEIISVVARQMGWRCTREHHACNVLWTDSIMGVETCRYMRRFQKINHFPGMFEICRKDLLARNMNRMLKLFPSDYQIFPKTWHLPADYGDAVKFSRQHRNRTYILKPDQGAQGRGISLTKSLKDVSPTEHIICQLYINRPLLIDGFKFDLRVYTLITSIDPLRVYVYNEGLARFATSPYREPKGHNTTNMYMHLTNYSVNKHSRTYSKDDELGSKRKFSTLNRILSNEGYDVVTLWNNIDDVVIKTIVSAWPVLRHNYTASFPTHDITHACFEILGVDIIIDQNLKPWLLEVNHSPSFHTDGPVDKEVKHALIRDTFRMLNVQAADKRRVIEEDKRRVNNRLLRKIKEFRGGANGVGSDTTTETNGAASISALPAMDTVLANASSELQQKRSRSPWLAQIEWEESHMGGFRRVLPVPGDPDKYTAFLDRQNNQASVFGETVASKKREEEAKQQRATLAEREKFPVVVKTYTRPAHASDDELTLSAKRRVHARRAGMRRLKMLHDGFHMEPVSDVEERERIALMAQRDFLVRSCGVLQYIYLGFYRNNLLSDIELKKYENLNGGPHQMTMLDGVGGAGGGCAGHPDKFAMQPERKLRLKSLSRVSAFQTHNITL